MIVLHNVKFFKMKKKGGFVEAEMARKKKQGKPRQNRAKEITKDNPVTYAKKLEKNSEPKGGGTKSPISDPKGRDR